MISVHQMPALNASLNGLAALLLIAGFYFIRSRRVTAHARCMVSAFAVSVLFLISYLIYHYHAGSTKFQGTGAVRTVYFSILLTHTVLAAAVPFLAVTTLYRAWKLQFDKHRRIARITFPIWLYVSITGVVIYLMLYQMDFGPVPAVNPEAEPAPPALVESAPGGDADLPAGSPSPEAPSQNTAALPS